MAPTTSGKPGTWHPGAALHCPPLWAPALSDPPTPAGAARGSCCAHSWCPIGVGLHVPKAKLQNSHPSPSPLMTRTQFKAETVN